MKCPVCESAAIHHFLHRENVPVHQNLLVRSRSLALGIPRGDIDLSVCTTCGFIFNSAFDPTQLNYSAEYDNNQTHSPVFNKYVESLAQYLFRERGLRNRRIAEIGCGNGYFLRKLVELPELGNIGYGFDPSYSGPLTDLDGRLQFQRRFYDTNCPRNPVDLVICRHVIEHVPDPTRLLRTIRGALLDGTEGRVFIETPCAEWILRRQVLWDVFYEHCSYFTADSLVIALATAGFTLDRVQRVFDEQYFWVEGAAGPTRSLSSSAQVDTKVTLCQELSAAEDRLLDVWGKALRNASSEGGVALWGAGAKGATFAHLLDPWQRYISCVVDLNPAKQGCFLPGTGHPIVSFKEMPKYDVKKAILMNPHYRDENLAFLREAKLNICLIDPMDWNASI